MKIALAATLTFAIAAAIPAAYAQTDENGFSVSAEGSYFEFDQPGTSRENGPMARFGGSYTTEYFDTHFTADLRLGVGVNDFTSGTEGNIDSIVNESSELRLLALQDVPISPTITLEPFLGLGYRVFFDSAGGSTSSNGGIAVDRLTQSLYLPFGVIVSVPFNDIIFKPSVEYDFLIDGNVNSFTRGVAGIQDDFNNNLSEGNEVRVRLDTEVETTNGKLLFGPFIRYTSTRASDLAPLDVNGQTIAFVFQPISHTIEGGFEVELHF